MQATQRKTHIMKMLREHEMVDVIELSRQLNTSKVTIRKDLDELAQKGQLMRTHGGAVLAERENLVRLIHNTLTEKTAEKQAICKCAAQLVTTGKSVIIDAGSTTVHLVPLIAKRQLTVITNSLLVMQELATSESIELLLIGGVLRRPSLSAIGNISYLSQIQADLLMLGASAFSLELGACCSNLIEAETKRAMIQNAAKVVLLADSSKFGNTALARICSWNEIDLLITDDKLSPEAQTALELKGVEVMIAR